MVSLRDIINRNHGDIAFIVGNGINRYLSDPATLSWDRLLFTLWQKFSGEMHEVVPEGITITEFYDLLEIAAGDKLGPGDIQKEVAQLLRNWKYRDHHKAFIMKAHEFGTPVLTTNFDLTLSTVLPLRQLYTGSGFTDYYPWNTCYSDRELQSPTDGFGVWYINGFIKYHRSLRLGLTHYMGAVERARTMLHKGEGRLFGPKPHENWNGKDTWLHILFNKPLCIFGLGLMENEVFIRWLLIERAKYFKKYPDRSRKGWYILPKTESASNLTVGKLRFLKGIGLEPVEAGDYSDIYDSPWV